MLDRQCSQMRVMDKAGPNTVHDDQSAQNIRVLFGGVRDPDRPTLKPLGYLAPRYFRG